MRSRYTLYFWILLLLLFIAKLLYIGWGPLDLAPDEAHYWDWSRHLDISYYSKGPFIAYNIFFGTFLGKLLGINPPNPGFWVRFPAVINSSLLGIIAWFFTNRLWRDKRYSFYVILILTAIPIYAVGSIITTVDNPLMLFWALYVYLVFLALDTGKGFYWCLSGLALGLGFLSKYIMIILIPCVFLYLLTTRQYRFWLARKEFYLGLLVSSIFFLPVLSWNIKYNWIGIRHLMGQAGVQKPLFSLHIFEFIGMQVGVVSPIIFILIIMGFIKAWILRNDYKYNFLFWTGIPIGIFYLILSLHEYCQANWPAPLYLTGAVLTGRIFCNKGILKIGIVLGIIMWLLVFCIDLFPNIPKNLDPTVRLRGWKKLGLEVGRIKEALPHLPAEGAGFIFSNTYQITSELAYYVPGQPAAYCVNLGRRMNQYDIWQDFDNLIGYNAVYVKHRDREIEEAVIDAFQSWEKLPLIDIEMGDRLIHQYSVFLCKGFKGFEKGEHEVTY